MYAYAFTCLTTGLLVLCGRPIVGDDLLRPAALRDGDRVVLVGGTLIEREQRFGYWEALLTLVHAKHRITFRNLGWSGDTVWGESRGMFQPDMGYQRLIRHVREAEPTVVMLAYGGNEAFAGEDGFDAFRIQYAKLLTDLQTDGRRFVLLSPLLMEASRLPNNPDAAANHAERYNRHVERYADAIETLARTGGHTFIDLRRQHRAHLSSNNPPLTFNGLHLTDAGYRQTARWLARRFSLVADFNEFDVETSQTPALRSEIIDKNKLFFHRWRPQNYTYLFGFRSHEQGQNAAEIPRFDPLIAAAERRIRRLAREARSTGGNKAPRRNAAPLR